MPLSSVDSARLFAAAILAFAAHGADAAAGAGLAPHQAVYDLSLAEESGDGGFIGADGRLVIELDDACDSWASSERMVLRMTSVDGARSVFDYRFSALEAKDGGSYRFTTATTANGREVERRGGRSTEAADGGRIVVFEQPQQPDVALMKEVRFPGDQLARLLEAAAAGERSYDGLLFEGVSERAISLSAAAISPLGDDPPAPEGLEGLDRWRVAVAHYDPDSPEGRPEYEMSFDLYENGVAARMRMVYEDFSLSARLSQVSIRPNCAN